MEQVIPLLQKKGLNVIAVQIPLTSLDNDISVTRNALAAQEGSDGTRRLFLWWPGDHKGGERRAQRQRPRLHRPSGLGRTREHRSLSKQDPAPAGAPQVRPDDHGFLWIDRDGFAKAFAADADPVEAIVMAAVQKL